MPSDPPPETAARPSERHAELDALRGLAAGVVVLFHAWMIVPWSGAGTLALLSADAPLANPELWFRLSPLRLATAGQAMVGLFFALSGVVLALPWVRGKPPLARAFLVKRFCRLYLPFAAAIAVAALLFSATARLPVVGASAWFAEAWAQPLTAGLLRDHWLMRGTTAAMSLDSVMWSLVHEARYSLVFPWLVLAALAWPRCSALAAAAAFLALSSPEVFAWITVQLAGPGPVWTLATLADTARYAPYFVGGILLASHLQSAGTRLAALRRPARLLLWGGALAALLTHPPPRGEVAWLAGALLLIALLVGSTRARGLLDAGPWRWLGRVSYSLYLVHVPILLAVVHAGWGRVPLWALLAAGIALALVGAHWMQRWVEHPCEQLGRRLAARIRAAASPGGRASALSQ